MDISKFLELRPLWGNEPHVYIIEHPATNLFRVGASGTHLHANQDLVYGADRATHTGLLGRCQLYKGFWLGFPIPGKIHACLRIKRQLVANPSHRTAVDFSGNTYNIDRGNHTLVLERESQLHQELDKRGLRWKPELRNELFVPGAGGVKNLITQMRTIQGEDMHLFTAEDIIDDDTYTGGRAKRSAPVIINTGPRQLPPRDGKDQVPTLLIKLNKKGIDDLRGNNPKKYELLLSIVKLAIEQESGATPSPPSAPAAPTPNTTFTPPPPPPPPTSGPPMPGPLPATRTPAPPLTPAPPANLRRSGRLMQAAMSAGDIEKLRKGDKKAQKLARALTQLYG